MPCAIIITGYGINCEEETAYGFKSAGADAKIVHINDLIEGHDDLKKYQILVFPGGFAYGDDTGAGKALANRVKNHLMEKVLKFVQKDKLILGICNGFQVIANIGLVPAFKKNYNEQCVALNRNAHALYSCRWTDLKVADSPACDIWFHNIINFSAPIGHGEGNFYTDAKTLQRLKKNKQIALRYCHGETAKYLNLPANPNGSLEDIASITDETGRVLGLMPHPDRALFFTGRPDWPFLKEKYLRKGKKLPTEGPGMQIFKNAVQYFQ